MSQDVNLIDRLVGRRVRAIRLGRGMSEAALAEKLGVTSRQVQQYEKGMRRIGASTLFEIAEALAVEMTRLFEDARDPDAVAMAEEQEEAAPSRIDLSIVRNLSQIRDNHVKRHVLKVISALANGEVTPTDD